MSEVRIRTGDTVRHRPSDEEWIVAFADYTTGKLAPCGWPGCLAEIADCDLLESCPDIEHEALVETLRNMGNDRGGLDFRAVAIGRLYPLSPKAAP